jgi:serine/threonine protein kinase
MPPYQSYQPAANAPLPVSQAQPVVVTARPLTSAAGPGTGQRSPGVERNSAPPPPPTRRRPSAGAEQPHIEEIQAASIAEELPLNSDENSWPASFRELTEIEKVNYSDLMFVESLGSGEFGQVFRGFYRREEVAIKELYYDDTLMTDIVLQDLAKEIESFRGLRHKRLVRFIGACLEMPHPCLVTQYMPGGSLHHLLHVRKLQLPPLHAINMCLQLADGVMYLHSQNPTVVHRDLKSLNVVLDMNLNVKICDFGLTESMERTHITKRNNGGSPRYMAPELFDNKTKVTEKIDIWALGCIFVEIFSGPLPYEQINTLADLTREMLVHRRSPDVPNHIFENIRMIIQRCLDFEPHLRPTSKQMFEQIKAAKRQLREAGLLEGSQESKTARSTEH